MESSTHRGNKPNTDDTWDDKAVDPAECGMIGALMNMSLYLFPKTRQSLQTMDGTRWNVHADEFSRNYVSLGFWNKSLEASTGALDRALDGCQSLRDDVVMLMCQVVEALYQGLTRFGQLDSKYSKDVDSLLEKAEASRSDDGGDTSIVRESLDDIVEDITSSVNALDDLAAALDHPVPDTTVQPELARPAGLLNEQDPLELFFDFIQHRFPKAEDKIIRQHAQANFARMLRLEELRAATTIPSEEACGSLAATKRSKDSGLGTSIGGSSAYATSTVSAIRKRNYNELLPRLPDSAILGEPFVCNFCQRAVQFRDNTAWNQHLLMELQPWVCIDADCTSSKKLFGDRKTWISHLATHISSIVIGSPVTCPLCREFATVVHDEMIGHFEQHLLQIALIIAPLGDYLEDESDLDGACHRNNSEVREPTSHVAGTEVNKQSNFGDKTNDWVTGSQGHGQSDHGDDANDNDNTADEDGDKDDVDDFIQDPNSTKLDMQRRTYPAVPRSVIPVEISKHGEMNLEIDVLQGSGSPSSQQKSPSKEGSLGVCCDICSRRFAGRWSKGNLRRHMMNVHDKDPARCATCAKNLTVQDILQNHQRCGLCARAFIWRF